MNETEVPSMIRIHLSVRILLSVLPCLLFLSVNSIMLFALLKKPLFLESPRYLLFGNLLLSDSLQVLLTTLLYVFALTRVKMITLSCVIVTQLTTITVRMSPLSLALMSMERYVAICFPLRHATIATTKATRVAIAVMWTLACLDSFIQLFLFFKLSNRDLNVQLICERKSIYQLHVYVVLNQVFTIINFMLVTLVIIYTYVGIMVAVRFSSSCAYRAKAAPKTVLLHALQLCLYLISTLFNMINSSELFNLDPAVAVQVRPAIFLVLIIFPRFLSPLIYSLRDQTLRKTFKYYFTFGNKSVEPYKS